MVVCVVVFDGTLMLCLIPGVPSKGDGVRRVSLELSGFKGFPCPENEAITSFHGISEITLNERCTNTYDVGLDQKWLMR
ncbi:hypothetical protein CHS0354_028044, partial [Potamilus streckersoni]